MLDRISEIQGVGLLHQANGKPFTCKSATLIYADNGRGKSTLATVLRSVATGDPVIINGCKTVDGTLPVKANLQFGSGHQVTFQNGAWSEKRPELLVFDADFIGRNVHSGGAVNTDHRKNLLDFALGDPAVTARQAVDKATADSKDATEKVSKLTDQLSGHHAGMLIGQFEQLPPVNDIDARLVELQKRVVAAGNVAAIQARPVPGVIAEPTFDIDGVFEVLGTSLQDIHAEAEKTVKLHIVKLGKPGAETWLSQGRQYSDGISCPFCNQDISSNDLVTAYQTHFNAAYANLKNRVAECEQKILNGTSDRTVTDFTKSVGVAVAQAKAWAEQVPTQEIVFDAPGATASLKAVREFLVDLVNKKQAAPAESFGSTSEKDTAVGLWAQFVSPLKATNTAIGAAVLLIGNYKTQLSGDSVSQLQQQIQILQATKRRYDPPVVALFAQLAIAKKDGLDVVPPEHPVFVMGKQTDMEIINKEDERRIVTVDVARPKGKKLHFVEPTLVQSRRLADGLGYLKVAMFPGMVGVEVANEISRAIEGLGDIDSLIIDLRGNTGGGIGALRVMSLLTPGRIPVGFSLPKNRVTPNLDSDKQAFRRFGSIPASKQALWLLALKFAPAMLTKSPIVLETEGLGAKSFHGRVAILVDRHTASAAEMIVAFAKENELATIVGEKTAGRLLSATSVKVGSGYRLALPTGAYYTWRGSVLEGTPIEPDQLVDYEWREARTGQDLQLQEAIGLIRDGITQVDDAISASAGS